MPKRKIPITPTPIKEDIREWVKNPTTQWMINKIALHLNTLDTVRDVTMENIEMALAKRLAIETVENIFSDIYEYGDLVELQKNLASEEDNILKKLKELKEDY